MGNTLETFKNSKNIGFFGLGKSNLSLLSGIRRDAEVTIRSDNAIDKSKIPHGINVVRILERDSALKNIDEEILVLSPSVRRDRQELRSAADRGVLLTSDCELFFESEPKKVFSVTGSSGKSTVSALAHQMLLKDGISSVLCGNGGTPMLKSIDPDASVYVTELSSFMLCYHKAVVDRCVITNITPNHLDFHKSFEEYRDAKLSLLRLSRKGIISADDKILSEFVGKNEIFGVFSTRIGLSELLRRHRASVYLTTQDGFVCKNGEKIIQIAEIRRKEDYNLKNALAALTLTHGIVSTSACRQALRSFGGLRHRAEFAGHALGVDYYDSSIDTTPERTAETLGGLGKRVILLLGGRGKGLPLDSLTETCKKYAKTIIAFGEEAESVAEHFGEEIPTFRCIKLADAVNLAAKNAQKGDTVLLSPAFTSYDEFTSFEERGELFIKLVKQIT